MDADRGGIHKTNPKAIEGGIAISMKHCDWGTRG